MRGGVRLWLILLLGCASGCRDDAGSNAQAPSGGSPRASDGGARIPSITGGRPEPEAGTDAGDLDAGLDDPMGAGLGECTEVEAAKVIGEGLDADNWYNAIVDPADFGATRVVATWGMDCASPTIQLLMSDGNCPDGRGHELRFELNAAAIADNSVRRGQNVLLAEPDDLGLRIRYVRPERIPNSGEWGTCAGVLGTVDYLAEPSSEAGAVHRFSFQLELAACNGSGADAMAVTGRFDGTLRRGLADACP